MPPVKHAVLGASSAERWLACPGSVRMSEGLPNLTTMYAQEGTAAHALAERCLNKTLEPEVWLGAEVEGVEVTEEMCQAVQVYLDYVHGLRLKGRRVWLETQFDLSDMDPPAEMFGTADCVAWAPQERLLEVVDYKHGQGVAVDAVGNPQVRYYALGACLRHRVVPKKIRTTIVQPRAHHPDGIIRSDELTWGELVRFKREVLFPGAERTLLPDAPLVPGDHCRFCPALARCPAQLGHAIEQAQLEFDIDEPEPTAELPVPQLLTGEQMLRVLALRPRLQAWLDAVYAYAHAEAEAGGDVPGWKLVAKRATRRWADDAKVVHWLDLNTDLRDEEVYTRKLVSPAQVEKLLKGTGLELPAELVVKWSSGTNLVPETNTAPPVKMLTAAEEFADL